MKISFICSIVNQLQYLEMLLWNIFYYQNFNQNEFEIIIVDDEANENILDYLKQNYAGKNIKYVRTNRKSRAGFPGACACRSLPMNLGVSFAKGEILIFCDPDCYMLESNHFSLIYEKLKFPKQIISAILTKADTPKDFDYIRENYKNPQKIVDYINIINPGNQLCGMRPQPGYIASNGKPEFIEIDGIIHQAHRHCRYWAIHRKDFIQLGGFDENSWWIAYDVMEMHYRLDNAGFSYIPSPLHILHIYHETYVLKENIETRWNCKVYPEAIAEAKKLRNQIGKMIKDKTLPIYLPWNPKFYDDDIYVDLSKKEKI